MRFSTHPLNTLRSLCVGMTQAFRYRFATMAPASSRPPASTPTRGQGHFGLIGLQERVRELGGTLGIETALGRGTTIAVSLPTAGCAPGT